MSPEGSHSDGPTAERILQAAAAVLKDNPAASMEAVASRAGLSRATVHRHFAARSDLVDALRAYAVSTVTDTFSRATDSPEPLVVRLYTLTAQLLAAKVDWSWILRDLEGVADEDNPVLGAAVHWTRHLRQHGCLDDRTNLVWAATVFLTLVKAATVPLHADDEIQLRAARAADAFLHGVGNTPVRYLTDDPAAAIQSKY